jgi:hypothetical protein
MKQKQAINWRLQIFIAALAMFGVIWVLISIKADRLAPEPAGPIQATQATQSSAAGLTADIQEICFKGVLYIKFKQWGGGPVPEYDPSGHVAACGAIK